ncbi:unnamed protein product, partial [Symbiodinium pilosum]
FLIVQFLQYYHYIFASVQAFIVLLTAREELCTLGLRRLIKALKDSLHYGLRTDDFLRLGQSERIIEGPLSLMLLVYTSFYMSSDTFAYITALFSMFMSTSSVAKGCYYHLDLALDSLSAAQTASDAEEVLVYPEVGAAREEHACSDKSPEVLPESGEAPCHEAESGTTASSKQLVSL